MKAFASSFTLSHHVFIAKAALWCALGSGVAAHASPKEDFFETKIRPVLVGECFSCHSEEKSRGGLKLDSAEGVHAGGKHGPLFDLQNPEASLLLKAISHQHEKPELHMPKNGAKLSESVFKDFQRWIAEGAILPDYTSAEKKDVWGTIYEERKKWWSYQPIQNVFLAESELHPVDALLEASAADAGLQFSEIASFEERRRRLHVRLTGLPPVFGQGEASWEKEVDRVLAMPSYGEMMARHWMDLVRYAESHGSEGDPLLPEAFHYRDYLIRAFNQDLPYDRFTLEHLAGDYLAPRLDPLTGLNDACIALAHLRMNEFGYQPVDSLDEQVKVMDNVIDVYSKTFLGLTVSCARCHDHKFDPIRQNDFFGLYGIFDSSRPVQRVVSNEENNLKLLEQLSGLKKEIKSTLLEEWGKVAEFLDSKLELAERLEKELKISGEELNRFKHDAGLRNAIEDQNLGLHQRIRFTEDEKWDGYLKGGARIEKGELILNGNDAFLELPALDQNFTEKSLEAWVKVGNLSQKGGGVISIETPEGRLFDAIVFGEFADRSWAAGSNNGRRSTPILEPELDTSSWIHMVVSYHADGSIQLYRNGKRYGAKYLGKGGIQEFNSGRSRLLIGKRHTGGGRAYFNGKMDEVAIYKKALSDAQVAERYKQGPDYGMESISLAELSPAKVQTLQQLRDKILMKEKDLNQVAPFGLNSWSSFLRSKQGEQLVDLGNGLDQRVEALSTLREGRREFNRKHFEVIYEAPKKMVYGEWYSTDHAYPSNVSPEGNFVLLSQGDKFFEELLPAGHYSNELTNRAPGVLMTQRFELQHPNVWVYHHGQNGGGARLIVDHYPLNLVSTFPQARPKRTKVDWDVLDTEYRMGSAVYLEFTTNADSPKPGALVDGRPDPVSSFGISKIYAGKEKGIRPKEIELAEEFALEEASQLLGLTASHAYAKLIRIAVDQWKQDQLKPSARKFLNRLIDANLLPHKVEQCMKLDSLANQYRRLEQQWTPTIRAPSVADADGFDAPLMKRGNHRDLGSKVPRGFLQVLSVEEKPELTIATGSGRFELAKATTHSANPLFARVMANRVWTWVFGKGLVASVDNFGRLGEPPTHPELLDYLAKYFMDHDYSIKKLIRHLVLTEAFQRTVSASDHALEMDPTNRYYARADVIRMSAEQIRDAILFTSGRMELQIGGPPVPFHSLRRSVYLQEKRNVPQPFLEVFDKPKPASTRGLRDRTNLPAQSLTLMNDPFVMDSAEAWAKRLLQESSFQSTEDCITQIYRTAFLRNPLESEIKAGVEYLGDQVDTMLPHYLHAIYSLKEFIYLR